MLAAVTPDHSFMPARPMQPSAAPDTDNAGAGMAQPSPAASLPPCEEADLATLLTAAEHSGLPLAAFAAATEVLAYLYQLDCLEGPPAAGTPRDAAD